MQSERMPERRNRLESPYLTVRRPQAHEGVGQALRQAFQARHDPIPADFTAMLDHLDRH